MSPKFLCYNPNQVEPGHRGDDRPTSNSSGAPLNRGGRSSARRIEVAR
ncbi:hypothetical protein [Micromonospora sp. DH14]|nr:hypothetical protein [Micromonospora sp. DH14]MDG9675878.1 hypothetical protein [Micromonospora sp. DH14]